MESAVPTAHPAQERGARVTDSRPYSRADTKERLQYLAAGTAGAAAPQDAGGGAVTDRAAGSSPPPWLFFICPTNGKLLSIPAFIAAVAIVITEKPLHFCACK